ncbi:MAG: tRNA pseudouridine(38-40) synthase TruA [Thermoanaerobaculales bacterium]|jgi:tRNA pseudouridine38-40 synthase|nr:tRNA pseudouridine(38-40) synthase TruA [Thermoanaerobaculales bacterium]
MPTYRLTIEYDGSKFSGWQTQVEQRTVQGVLLKVLRELTGDDELTLHGAGRTDAGVHALAQVASLRCARRLVADRLLARLERALPADLAVLDLRPAADRFHARHDAVARCYRYQIARRRSAFGKRATWWIADPLDPEPMRAAAARFVGRHDFAAFARPGHRAPSTIVVVDGCELWELGELILLRVVASHFLWGQVRRMVGALAAVGRGAAGPDDVALWLDGSAPPPEPAAPAAGLFLERVWYPGEPRALPPPAPVGVPWSHLERRNEGGDRRPPARRRRS